MTRIKDGTIRHSSEIDFTDDFFKRSHETRPGWYVMYGMWKGPFEHKSIANDCYQEWAWEARVS